MVAISDMKKPKSCIKCDVHIAHDYCDHFSQFGVGAKTDGVYSDCPLIDIVPCKECKHRDPEDKKCDCGKFERQGCIFPVADDYFCKYGERRE